MCVDDTDDLTKSTSTGAIAELLMREMQRAGCAVERGITRHQLLLHADIAYTSHNSSMCFAAGLECPPEGRAEVLEGLWRRAVRIVEEHMAATADPGLCLCRMDRLEDADRLIDFGRRAQREVLHREEAYQVATRVGGVRLEALGGTGAGIIGALAGVGLRLTGNDGTLRGKHGVGQENVTLPAGRLRQLLRADRIITTQGEALPDDAAVFVRKNVKLVLLQHQIMAVVQPREGRYEACKSRTCTRETAREEIGG